MRYKQCLIIKLGAFSIKKKKKNPLTFRTSDDLTWYHSLGSRVRIFSFKLNISLVEYFKIEFESTREREY